MNRRSDDIDWRKAAVMILGGLLALWLFAGCGKGNVQIEYVEKLVPVQATLDPRLLAVPAPVPAPPFDCTDARGGKTVCTEDAIDWGERWKKVGTDLIEQIKAIKGLQPAEGG